MVISRILVRTLEGWDINLSFFSFCLVLLCRWQATRLLSLLHRHDYSLNPSTSTSPCRRLRLYLYVSISTTPTLPRPLPLLLQSPLYHGTLFPVSVFCLSEPTLFDPLRMRGGRDEIGSWCHPPADRRWVPLLLLASRLSFYPRHWRDWR